MQSVINKIAAVICLFFACVWIAGAVTIYVNAAQPPPGDGSAGNPYTAITSGVARLATENAIVKGGHTVSVAAGTYAGPITLTASHAGLNGASNTFLATGAATVTGGAYCVSIITPAGGSGYIVIDGFRLTGAGTDGVYVENSTSNTIQNCDIYGILNIVRGYGIYITGGSAALRADALVKNCNIFGNGSHGIRLGYYANVSVRNCNIVNNNGVGVREWHGSGYEAVLAYNNIYDNGLGNFYDMQAGIRNTPAEMNAVPGCSNNVSANPSFPNLANNWNFNAVYTNSPLLNAGEAGTDIGAHQNPPEFPTSANTYYVNGATGNDANSAAAAQNPASPWASISRAARTAVAGDTVSVAAGTYAEQVVITNSGCAGLPVAYRASGAVTVSAGGAANAFYLDRVNKIILDGFECIAATNAGCFVAVSFDNTFTNLSLRGNTGWGIFLTDVSVMNRIVGCDVYGNTSGGTYLYRVGVSTVDVCRVHDNGSYGIFVNTSPDVAIQASDVFCNTTAEIYMAGDVSFGAGGTIRNCNIFGNFADGLYTYNYAKPWVVKDCNIMANTRYAAYAYHYADSFTFSNNNFYANGKYVLFNVGTGYGTVADLNLKAGCTNNFSANPGFADLRNNWNFNSLYAGLPCLGAGTGGGNVGRPSPAIVPVSDKTYYVNGAIGSDANTPAVATNPATPWATIQRAARTAIAGDAVSVAAGTYVEQVTITNAGSGAAPVTYRASGDVTVDGTAYGFYLDRASAVVLNGFKVTGSATAGIGLNRSCGNTINNAVVYTNAGCGIAMTNTANNNTIGACDIFSNATCGIQMVNSSGNEVGRSLVHHNTSDGIYVRLGGRNVIQNCAVYTNLANGLNLDGVIRSIGTEADLYNCVFYGNKNYGVVAGYSTGGNAVNCVVANNLRGLSLSHPGYIWMYFTNGCWFGNGTNVYGIEYTPKVYNTVAEMNGLAGWSSNIVADPGFINGPAGNFRFSKSSPCVDAGTRTSPWPADYYGRPRLSGLAVDLGYYEYQYPLKGTIISIY